MPLKTMIHNIYYDAILCSYGAYVTHILWYHQLYSYGAHTLETMISHVSNINEVWSHEISITSYDKSIIIMVI
jgi:hypothetical protein